MDLRIPLSASKRRTLAAGLILLPLLAACGKSGDGQKPASQVAVKVNGDEISVHQISQALSRVGQVKPENAEAAGKQVLEQLIDQQLLIQKSLDKKLDRDPDVLNALEASRRQILSQAYLEKSLGASVGKPRPDEVKKFYDEHPQLFAERRVYRLQELTVTATPEQVNDLNALTAKTKNLNEVAAWLRQKNIRFSANAAVRPAEQLPMEALPRVAAMKDGDVLISQSQGAVTVLQLVATQPMPLNESEAGPYIEQYLYNRERTAVAEREMKQLRQTAKLEYMGNFVKTAAGPQAGRPGEATAATAGAASAKGAAVGAGEAGRASGKAANGAADNSANVIDKGVSGLK